MTTRCAAPAVRPRRRQRGVGLVEILVAMLVGLFLLAGAVTVFMQGRNTSRTADSVSRMQETLRYALDAIEPDVRMANFWGMTNRNDLLSGIATPLQARTAIDNSVTNNCGVNWTANLAQFIDGRDNGNYDLTCPGANVVAWADVLIVRRASANQTALAAGKLQIATNRVAGMLFRNGVQPAGFLAAPLSEVHDLFVNAYFIAEILPSPNGIRQWALHRMTLAQGALAPQIVDSIVVRGISDLQVQFGVDTNADNSADVYVNPEAAELATGRVVSVRLWLMAMADDPEIDYLNTTAYTLGNQVYPAPNDNRRRMVIQKTISLRDSQGP